MLLGLAGAAFVAWVLMMVMLVGGGTSGGVSEPLQGTKSLGGLPAMICALPGMASAPAGSGTNATLLGAPVGTALAMWALMVAAMMLPAELPAIAHVGANSLRWRRQRSMLIFAAVYLALWIGFGAVLLTMSRLWAPPHGVGALVAASLVAAAWQLTPAKLRAAQDCHRTYPLAPRGWAATHSVAAFAVRHGAACLRSCWALMTVMGVAGAGLLFWMAAIAGMVVVERSTRTPRRTTRAISVALACGAVLSAAGQLLF
jgi:predicted metal-binding membrane protein